MGKINTRAKGHTYERSIAELFRSLGWERCVTSRSESRNMDALKVDLCYTDPFYIQAKAVEKLGSIHALLEEMPKHEGKINIVWHKKNRQGSIVAMKSEDFVKLVKLLKDNNLL